MPAYGGQQCDVAEPRHFAATGPGEHAASTYALWHEAGADPINSCLEKSIMKQLKRLTVLLLAMVFVSALGCAGSATKESTGEYVTDSWITTKVKAALVEDSQVKATEVNVETFKGTVQLSGFVSSDAAMRRAVQLTRETKGVTSVKNDMRIK
jgi:hyperosmotically inducible protein